LNHFNTSYQNHTSRNSYKSLSEVGAGISTIWATRDLVPSLYTGTTPDARLSRMKGDFLESLQRGLVPGNGDKFQNLTPHRIGFAGIDGLLVQSNNGDISKLLVVESKYGSSRLNPNTLDGRQMSESWIIPRLKRTAMMYTNCANALENSTLRKMADDRPDELLQILGDIPGAEQLVLRHGNAYSSNSDLTKDEIVQRLRNVSSKLMSAANGAFPYESILLKMRSVDNQFLFSVYALDREGHQIGPPTLEMPYSNLSLELKNAVNQRLEQTLSDSGFPERHINKLKDAILHNPELLKIVQSAPEIDFLAPGLDAIMGGLSTGALSGLITFLISSRSGGYRTDFNWDVTRTAIAVGVSSSIGTMFGYNSAAELEVSYFGEKVSSVIGNVIPDTEYVEELIGSIGGGAVAGLSYNVIRFIMGQSDVVAIRRGLIRTGTKIAFSGAATSGTMAAVMTFAAASTGTQISALSGVAAHNATMAFLGGGSVASGGGGMAVGTMVLTGIGTAVGIAATIGITLVFKNMDEAEKQRYLSSYIEIVERQFQLQ
jgi:hypothetical protein